MAFSDSLKIALARVIGVRSKKYIKYYRLRLKELLGVPPYTGANQLDRKLDKYLSDRPPGFFIEAGANDGIDQSNTYYLERVRGWNGLLIEPSEPLVELARKFRKAKVVHAALGAPESAGTTISFPFRDHVSSIHDNGKAFHWAGWFGKNIPFVTAQVRTLSDILEEAGNPAIGLFSLDVEGYELPVLKGLDLERHRPDFILVETSDVENVALALGDKYRLIEQLSHHDFLFQSVAAKSEGGE